MLKQAQDAVKSAVLRSRVTRGLFHLFRLREVPSVVRIDNHQTGSNRETNDANKRTLESKPIRVNGLSAFYYSANKDMRFQESFEKFCRIPF